MTNCIITASGIVTLCKRPYLLENKQTFSFMNTFRWRVMT